MEYARRVQGYLRSLARSALLAEHISLMTNLNEFDISLLYSTFKFIQMYDFPSYLF
jgi:hypothetical protein